MKNVWAVHNDAFYVYVMIRATSIICRNTRFVVCLVISVDPTRCCFMQRLVGIYTYTVHRCTQFLEFNITINERSHTERARVGTPDRELTFSLLKCTCKIYCFWRDSKSANPGPMLLLRVRPGFALIAVCSSVIHRNIQLAMMRRLWW